MGNPVAFGRITSFFGRFLALPLAVRGGILVAAVAIFAVATWKGYHTYDYIQHDNDFCQSCHLMEEPFRRFEASGHRGLSCKSCHHPNMYQRSKMALTQFVEQPTEISQHAHVPNEVCAKCHIDGDPDRWKLIAQTAGHQVHLESDQLEGLQCVKCHTAAIHDFVPLDRTCGQSDCHPTVKVNLGKMANETELHCVSCHDFLAEPGHRLGPRQEDCLQCHAMRERLANFQVDDDPHEGECRDCHNAHEHAEPAEAVESCLKAGCHATFLGDPESMPVLHRGLEDEIFRNCLNCHQAHVWKVASVNCQDCHDIPGPTAIFGGQHFEHSRHGVLECTNCHDDESTHGRLRLDTALDCMGCHHMAQNSFASCESCHDESDLAGARTVSVALEGTDGEPSQSQQVQFEHLKHTDLECSDCHDSEALLGQNARALATGACSDCHGDEFE